MATRRQAQSTRWVALLRGINVGGNNVIPMAKLKACFERLGFGDVVTYIQSGNVVFSAPGPVEPLAQMLERGLAETFSYTAKVVVLSAAEVARVVDEAPRGFGARPDEHRYDVLFVRPPLRAAQALELIPVNPAVDLATAGTLAVYYRRVIALASKSRLAKLTQLPVYQQLTVRNWNTTTKLADLSGPKA